MRKLIFALLFLPLSGLVNAQRAAEMADGIYARFTTNKGIIVCQLEYKKVPMTVGNFVGLAEGKLKVNDKVIDKPFFDGLLFHRVIADFMIQGGDPLGNGSGDPGYKFYDEIDPTLKHTGPGILSMANSGPNTNGSQFFITHKETPWLDGKHAVFGHVVLGQEVVSAIAQNDTMKKVDIIRVGKEAQKWNAQAAFDEVYVAKKALEAAQEAEMAKVAAMSQEEYKAFMFKEVQQKYPKAVQSETGLVYVILDKGAGAMVEQGKKVSLHYTGTFRRDGKKFDSSKDRNVPLEFEYKVQRMIPGFEEGITYIQEGGKILLFIPYYNAYGKQGRPGAIPPYADLVFEIELLKAAAEPHDHPHGENDGHQH
jgi:cyclophilin family peptidyl-prolyl cis-trans isomerase